MRSAGKARERFQGARGVSGLSEDAPPDVRHRVGAEHEGFRMQFRSRLGLAPGQAQHVRANAPAAAAPRLRSARGPLNEDMPAGGQQLRPGRRGRRQDEDGLRPFPGGAGGAARSLARAIVCGQFPAAREKGRLNG